MVNRLQDLTGRRFGRLVVLRRFENPCRGTKWACQCDCGNSKTAHAASLKNGDTKSCGCLSKEAASKRATGNKYRLTHEMSGTPEYLAWNSMLNRCNNSKVKSYPRYGGRGIKVCEQWVKFDSFISDMGARPSPVHSLERRDTNGNYDPLNCKWATREEQANNRSNNRLLDYKGAKITLSQASRIAGISRMVIAGRLSLGWTIEDAISTPKRGSRIL